MITKYQGAEKMCLLSNAGTIYHSYVSYISELEVLPRLNNIILLKGCQFRFKGFLYIGSL